MANGTEDTLSPQDVMDEAQTIDAAINILMKREDMRSAMVALVRLHGLRHEIMGRIITLVGDSYRTTGQRFRDTVVNCIESRAEGLADAATAEILKG